MNDTGKQLNPENADQKIPVVVGVTGHRDLVSDETDRIRDAVRSELGKIKAATPNSPHALLCCLAEGADLLCAEIALEEGYLLYAALPMEASVYEQHYSEPEMLKKMLDRAAMTFVVPHTEPYQNGTNYLYRQADIYVAVHCHVLLALWDGKEGTPTGCGTAETAAMKLKNSYLDCADRPLHPADGALIRIAASRLSGDFRLAEPGSVQVYGDESCLKEMLRKTDLFNKDADELSVKDLISGRSSEMVYDAADRLSVKNAKRHKGILGVLAIAATLLTISFLLYDEAEQYWLIILCGVMILCLFLSHRLSKRMESHRKYLDYRVLAESLRVQLYMYQAGVAFEVSEYLPWNLQAAVPWVRKAIAVCSMEDLKTENRGTESDSGNIRESWIKDQMEYHRSALDKTKKQETSNDRIVRGILFLTVFTYFLALIFEFVFGGLFGREPLLPPEQLGSIRTILKITLGSFSAITLFAGNYYGKLSLENVIDDHDKMVCLYEQAEAQVAANGETAELFKKLAKEALAENSAWYSYEGTNSADINL